MSFIYVASAVQFKLENQQEKQTSYIASVVVIMLISQNLFFLVAWGVKYKYTLIV